MCEEKKAFEFSATIVAEDQAEAEHLLASMVHRFIEEDEPWESFGEIKEIPFEKNETPIKVVYCKRLEWDYVNKETYCSLEKSEYPKDCGSKKCSDFEIREE